MATIIPRGEAVKKAVRQISDRLKNEDKANIEKLISEAVFQFKLTPREAQFLYHFYRSLGKKSG